jgi:hypothetical protein
MTSQIDKLFNEGLFYIDNEFFSTYSINLDNWALELKNCFYNPNYEIKQVNNDGIKIKTINGDLLFLYSPETAKAYKAILNHFTPLLKTGLFEIENKKIAYSENFITNDDSFRFHFDRNDFTVVFYLSDAPKFPLVMYPLVRPNGMLKLFIRGTLMRYAWFKYVTLFKKKYVIYPKIGKIVCFLGNQNLHGISASKESNDMNRFSVQLAFNFTNKNEQIINYYGE